MSTLTMSHQPSTARLLWFRDLDVATPFINDTAVRIRAGIMLAIPLFMAFTLANIIFGSKWIVTGQVIRDTFDTDFDGRILYMVEAIRRTYDYSIQTWVLFYALFEMLVSMGRKTAYLSPTIWLSTFLSRHQRPVWKSLAPKRFAWTIGASMICLCLVFFHPEKFALIINTITQHDLLPATEQYLPRWLPLLMVWLCLGFMWLEAILGFCVGCQIHALLVKMGMLEDACEACNNLNFD
jgi:hypothetical protein